MSKLMGSSGSVSVGAPQLMPWIAGPRENVNKYVMKDVILNPDKYFKPMDMTADEVLAGSLMRAPFEDPQAYAKAVGAFLNPYRDIISQDIQKAYEAPSGQLAARASEAGAFGSTRHRGGQADLERSRLDAIANAMSGQYNIAQNQLQGGIADLLGFGGFARELDLAQRQAPIRGAESYTSLMVNPYLQAPSYTPTTIKKGSSGLLGSLGQIGQIASMGSSLFSGISGLGAGAGLWGGLDPATGITWNSGRVI